MSRRRLLIPLPLLIVLASVSPLWAIRDLTGFSPDQQTNSLQLQTQGAATSTPTSVASGTPSVTLTPAFTPSPTPTTEPQQLSDVRLTLAAAPAEVRPGEGVTYTLGLANAGAVRATDLVISDTLPAGGHAQGRCSVLPLHRPPGVNKRYL